MAEHRAHPYGRAQRTQEQDTTTNTQNAALPDVPPPPSITNTYEDTTPTDGQPSHGEDTYEDTTPPTATSTYISQPCSLGSWRWDDNVENMAIWSCPDCLCAFRVVRAFGCPPQAFHGGGCIRFWPPSQSGMCRSGCGVYWLETPNPQTPVNPLWDGVGA